MMSSACRSMSDAWPWNPPRRLVQQDAGIGQRDAQAGRACHQQERAHRAGRAHAHRGDRAADILHRVVDGEAAGHHAARRVDVERDLLLRIVGFQRQQLRADQRRDIVVDRPVEEDDALAQQPRENVEGALAAARLLDHHGDEIADAAHRTFPFRLVRRQAASARRDCRLPRSSAAACGTAAACRTSCTMVRCVPPASVARNLEGDRRIAARRGGPRRRARKSGSAAPARPSSTSHSIGCVLGGGIAEAELGAGSGLKIGRQQPFRHDLRRGQRPPDLFRRLGQIAFEGDRRFSAGSSRRASSLIGPSLSELSSGARSSPARRCGSGRASRAADRGRPDWRHSKCCGPRGAR